MGYSFTPRLLWVSVLRNALQDAADGKDTTWIGSRDFAQVCFLAGVDPVAVREAYTKRRDLLKTRHCKREKRLKFKGGSKVGLASDDLNFR
ncbi:MAG: hypothetical protein U1D06_08135 [Paracoccaceae bacterium]|nr:hypothetical protein [Paracoccaceae bacterium]